MNRRTIPQALGAAIAMDILILDHQYAVRCVSEGIGLCIQTVIPALFPFFVLSSILAASLNRLPKVFLRLFRIDSCGGSILLTGLLGGYPVGAKNISEAYRAGHLSKAEAERLLPICNQCGPAFIFGMTAALFSDIKQCFMLWEIQLVSVLLMAWIIPPRETSHENLLDCKPISWSEALHRAIRAMASVCGWIILFRLLIRFVQRWLLWRLPLPYQITVSGLLELTNGCTALHQIADDNLRFALCAVFTCFGGICVTMQSYSVLHSDLNRTYYFPGKLLQVSLVILLVSLAQQNMYPMTWIAIPTTIGFLLFFRKNKKTVAFSNNVIYNSSIKDTRKLLCSLEKR